MNNDDANDDDEDDGQPSKKVPVRTISSYSSFDKKSINNLLTFMSHESKNSYNTSIFHTQIFFWCKNNIYKQLYELVTNNEITSVKDHDNRLYQLYDPYYQKYLLIKPFKIFNNNIIYKFIVTNLEDVYVINDNFDFIEKFVVEYFENHDLLKFPINATIDIVHELFYNIVFSILKSFYYKNFNKTKEEILSKKKCTIEDKTFIEQVKNGEELYNEKEINYKELLKSHDLFKDCPKGEGLKSDQNYIARIVSRYYSDCKIPKDVMTNIIPKAYQAYSSYFALRKKGIKANIPNFLPKDGYYVIPFSKNSFKEITLKNGREIKIRKPRKPRKTNKRKNKKTIKKTTKKKSKKRVKTKGNYYRLTVGKTISFDYIEIIDDDKYICLNPNAKSYKKIYIDKQYLTKIESGMKVTKKDNFIIDGFFVPKKSSHIVNTYYIYIKKPKKLDPNDIRRIEIVPLYDAFRFKINFIIKLKKTDNEPIKGKELSIDLGKVNLAFMYNPHGNQYIIKGSILKSINYYYNKRIDKLKSELTRNGTNKLDTFNQYMNKYQTEIAYVNQENGTYIPKRETKRDPDYITKNKQLKCVMDNFYNKKFNEKQLTSKAIRNLFIQREQRINQYFDKVVNWIITTFHDYSRIIVGYNKEWKQNVNMGKKNNRDFYEIPYSKFIKKLKDAMIKNNMELVLREESYTSKCDALALEPVEKHEKYLGERIERGLFASSTGVLINADLDGAINIMRKQKQTEGAPMKKIKGENLCNPITVKILSDNKRKTKMDKKKKVNKLKEYKRIKKERKKKKHERRKLLLKKEYEQIKGKKRVTKLTILRKKIITIEKNLKKSGIKKYAEMIEEFEQLKKERKEKKKERKLQLMKMRNANYLLTALARE